jgi:hypothetical protein
VTTSAPRACEQGRKRNAKSDERRNTQRERLKKNLRAIVRRGARTSRFRSPARRRAHFERVLERSSFPRAVTRQRRETRPVPAGRTLTTARARAKPAVPVRVLLGWRCECFESSRRCLWAGYPRVPGTGRANAFAKSRGKRASRET